jgi:hypothetical protein
MYYMMFEPNGQPVRTDNNGVVFEAATNCYYAIDGVLTIQNVD